MTKKPEMILLKLAEKSPAKATPLSNISNLPKLISLMAFKLNKTIPAPAQFLEEFLRPENQANAKEFYPNQEDLDHDVATAYHQVIEDLYAAGCRTLQLDDCTWGISVNAFANLKKKTPMLMYLSLKPFKSDS